MVHKHVEFFKALSDNTRQEILHLLEERERNVSEICEIFEHMSQPTISHHLQILRTCGLVDTRKEGKLIYYIIRKKCMHEHCKQFFGRFSVRIEIE